MTMINLVILIVIALFIGVVASHRSRGWSLLFFSILAVFWLQPSTPIRNLDFWMPLTTLGLTIFSWAATQNREFGSQRTNLLTGGMILLVTLVIGLLRYLPPLCCLGPARPPVVLQVVIGIAAVAIPGLILHRFFQGRRRFTNAMLLLLLGVFVVLKQEALSRGISFSLRSLTGQSTDLASSLDIGWLGFSYVAFRLIHTIRDRLTGRLPAVSLQEYVIYVIFFPAIIAGPIDRLQRFLKELRAPFRFTSENLGVGMSRILFGIFKKFVVANTLALVSLNAVNASQVTSPGWMMLLVYVYAFRIYYDFSGYTDIAIGLGNLLGFTIPENFTSPYLKTNLTVFWNSWHMTLAQWFRAYFFNPVTRAMRRKKRPVTLILLAAQIGTMLLIGLWHGITWNFFIWGLWHGIGLFVHNRWSTFRSLANNFGVVLTFHYVALGWIWFSLPTLDQSWRVFRTILGLQI